MESDISECIPQVNLSIDDEIDLLIQLFWTSVQYNGKQDQNFLLKLSLEISL